MALHLAFAFDLERAAALASRQRPRLRQQRLVGLGGHVDAAGRRVRLHAAGGVHGVAEQAVPRVDGADDAGHHRPDVEAHPNAHRALLWVLAVHGHRRGSGDSIEGEPGDPQRVVGLRLGQPRRAHVRVSYGLDLEEAVDLGQLVELGVQAVQHVHDFLGRHLLGHAGKPHDVAEEDGHRVVRLGLHLLPLAQRLGHLGRQDVVQQRLLGLGARPAREHALGLLHLADALLDLLQRRPAMRVLQPALLHEVQQRLRHSEAVPAEAPLAVARRELRPQVLLAHGPHDVAQRRPPLDELIIWVPADPDFVHGDAQGVDVRFLRAARAFLEELRGHPQRGAPGQRAARRLEEGQPEVADLRGERGVDEDVLGLEVAVDEGRLRLVQVAQALDDVQDDPEQQLHVHRVLPVDHGVQGAVLHLLHDDPRRLPLAAEHCAQRLDDVGVPHPHHHLELLPHVVVDRHHHGLLHRAGGVEGARHGLRPCHLLGLRRDDLVQGDLREAEAADAALPDAVVAVVLLFEDDRGEGARAALFDPGERRDGHALAVRHGDGGGLRGPGSGQALPHPREGGVVCCAHGAARGAGARARRAVRGSLQQFRRPAQLPIPGPWEFGALHSDLGPPPHGQEDVALGPGAQDGRGVVEHDLALVDHPGLDGGPPPPNLDDRDGNHAHEEQDH
mmetsp:Transcript_8110/g.22928  ORF Transcript_8110/g.22928 Transcript_8110/m.22928 type:complete len:673 (+) Transcript_8110:947-2965(+)